MRGRFSSVRLVAAIVTSILLLGTGAAAVQAAADASRQAESLFLDLINTARQDSGHPPVDMAADLQEYARSHADRMARENDLQHSDNLGASVCCWQRIGENVGLGAFHDSRQDAVSQAVEAVHRRFLDSSGHRATMLDAGHLDVGIGVVADSDAGRLWVAHVFRTPRPSSTGADDQSDEGEDEAEDGEPKAGTPGRSEAGASGGPGSSTGGSSAGGSGSGSGSAAGSGSAGSGSAAGSGPAGSTSGSAGSAGSGSAPGLASSNPGQGVRDASANRRPPAANRAAGPPEPITRAGDGEARPSDARRRGNPHPFAARGTFGPARSGWFDLLGLHRHAHPRDFGLDDRGQAMAASRVDPASVAGPADTSTTRGAVEEGMTRRGALEVPTPWDAIATSGSMPWVPASAPAAQPVHAKQAAAHVAAHVSGHAAGSPATAVLALAGLLALLGRRELTRLSRRTDPG